MKKLCALFATAALACTMSLPAVAQQKDTAKIKRVQMAQKEKGKHPNIEAAMMHLREAKESLEKASHDYGGHRSAALKHVNEALEECRDALTFDKK